MAQRLGPVLWGTAVCNSSDEAGRAALSRSGAASIAASTALGHATRRWEGKTGGGGGGGIHG